MCVGGGQGAGSPSEPGVEVGRERRAPGSLEAVVKGSESGAWLGHHLSL